MTPGTSGLKIKAKDGPFKGQHTWALTWERWEEGCNCRENYHNNQTQECWEGLRELSVSTSTHLPLLMVPRMQNADKGNRSGGETAAPRPHKWSH